MQIDGGPQTDGMPKTQTGTTQTDGTPQMQTGTTQTDGGQKMRIATKPRFPSFRNQKGSENGTNGTERDPK
jgi:hypothetical protein